MRFHLCFFLLNSTLFRFYYQSGGSARFTQAKWAAAAVSALGLRLGKCGTAGKIIGLVRYFLCVLLRSFLTFIFHFTSVAVAAECLCGGVKVGRIGVGIRRVESSRPRCMRSVCCGGLVFLPHVTR